VLLHKSAEARRLPGLQASLANSEPHQSRCRKYVAVTRQESDQEAHLAWTF
jgi:hypothetical protein